MTLPVFALTITSPPSFGSPLGSFMMVKSDLPRLRLMCAEALLLAEFGSLREASIGLGGGLDSRGILLLALPAMSLAWCSSSLLWRSIW